MSLRETLHPTEFIAYIATACVVLMSYQAEAQDTQLYATNFAKTNKFADIAPAGEYSAWSSLQLMPAGPEMFHITRSMPSSSDFSVFYSRRFTLDGKLASENNLRIDTRASVNSVLSLADGTMAALIKDTNSGVDNLHVQIYGPQESIRWYVNDLTSYEGNSTTLNNIVLKACSDSEYGVLFNNATEDGTAQHVFFQTFDKKASVEWEDGPLQISPKDSLYYYSAISFSIFSNGSFVILYKGLNATDTSQYSIFYSVINANGEFMTAAIEIFNYTTPATVNDVISFGNYWVASIVVTDSVTSYQKHKLLFSEKFSTVDVTETTGVKEIDSLMMVKNLSSSVIAIYSVTFIANSTVFWKASTFNAHGNRINAEQILIMDGEVLGKAVGSDRGLYVAVSSLTSGEQSIKLGLLYDRVEAFTTGLITTSTLLIIGVLISSLLYL